MIVKNSVALLIGLAVIFEFVPAYRAQEATTQQHPTEQLDKDKVTSEKKAILLLDQIIGDAGALKLSENRIYIQVSAGDLLWDRDQSRARALFSEAAGNVADLIRRNDPTDRRSANANRIALELRQELVLAVAKHDGELAYQLLQTMPAPPATGPGVWGSDPQSTLEQSLVAAIAANDPKTALKNAQEWLDKGEYPSSISKVLSQLQAKDAESAAKLADKLVKRLQPEELLAKQDAARLTLNLLRPGPRPDKKSVEGSRSPASASQVLTESAYRDVLSAAIAAALRATPQTSGTQRRAQGGLRGGANNPGRATNAPQSEADLAQVNAQALLSGLQTMLQQVDQYLPDRSLALRQKLTQLGMGDDRRGPMGQIGALMQQGTSESLIKAAASAPQGMQSRIYQQAAMKALDEDNPDRAREIASQHLDGTARDNVLHAVDVRQATRSASPNKMDQIRATIAAARSDDERISLSLQFANTLQSKSPKLALQLLDEARSLATRRATNYGQLELQLNVAHAFAQLDPSRSFDTLEPGINQINELLSAAAVLSGFEVNVFKEGELPLQGGGSLSQIVMRYGTELASLAKIDFERAQMTADKFQLAEPRILAKLTMVRGVLGASPIGNENRGFGFDMGGSQFGRRPQ
jgi:hypothetical protein